MPRQHHHRSRSNYPVSKPTAQPIEPSRQEREIFERIEGLLDAGEADQALRQLELAPKWVQRGPFFDLLRAIVLMRQGDVDLSGNILRELEGKNPGFLQLYPPLATWYLFMEWPAHALNAVKKGRPYSGSEASLLETVKKLEENACDSIRSLAESLGCPFDPVQQAAWHHEQAQMATRDGNFHETVNQARQALALTPRWHSPRNNLAQALFLLGKCPEAMAETEVVLTADPDNIHGLENMTIFQVGLGNIEKGREAASRLFTLAEGAGQELLVNDLAVLALAVVEDSEHLWELAQRYLKWRVDALDPSSWHSLAVAAARSGRLKEALKLARRSAGGENNPALADLQGDLAAALKDGKTRLSWPPLYPVTNLFLPDHLIDDWLAMVGRIEGDKPSPAQLRQIHAFLARYPFLLQAFRRLLWSRDGSQSGASALVLADQPDLDGEVLRFGLSADGDDDSRMEALLMLSKSGRFSPEGPIRFWNAEQGEWRDVHLFSQQIAEMMYDIKPETAELVDRSRQAKDPRKAIELLRRAVASDPGCALVVHNLGALLIKQGEKEEGKKYLRKAIEVDPSYTFGFANLAFLEAQQENEKAALDLLLQVHKAKQISPATAVIANLAHVELSLLKKDFVIARQHFDLAMKIDPGNPLLDDYEERLDQMVLFSKRIGFLVDYQRQSANRFHRKMLHTPLAVETTLETCLTALTTDGLGAICQFWGVIGYGRKQEKVARLVKRIMDPEILRSVAGDLDDEEKAALHWMLEGGGVRLWEEFTKKFGDDMDESPYWQWHEPESLPGCLKRAGFLHVGTLDDSQVAFVPADLRAMLKDMIRG